MKIRSILESLERNLGNKSAVILIGRFNPPTVAHEKLIKYGINLAKKKGAQFFLYTTRSHDRNKNPLQPEEKLAILKEIFPGVKVNLVGNIYDEIFKRLDQDGYKNIFFISGSDRGEEYMKMIERGNKKGDFNLNVNFVTIDRSLIQAENIQDVSATKARTAALNDNFDEFKKIMAGKNTLLKKRVFDLIRERMI